MPNVADILRDKGSTVHRTHPGVSVLDAIHEMNQHKLGALVVTDRDRVVGMFTERDVLRRVMGAQLDPSTTTVREVMTARVFCSTPAADLDEIGTMMQQHRVRHVPICDESGELVGLVSMGDLNAFHVTHQEATISFLNEYIYGRA